MPSLKHAKSIFQGLAFGILVLNAPFTHAATMENLRCEARVNPAGIDVTKPRLSWVIQSARRGAAQSAYQVLVAASAEAVDLARPVESGSAIVAFFGVGQIELRGDRLAGDLGLRVVGCGQNGGSHHGTEKDVGAHVL